MSHSSARSSFIIMGNFIEQNFLGSAVGIVAFFTLVSLSQVGPVSTEEHNVNVPVAINADTVMHGKPSKELESSAERQLEVEDKLDLEMAASNSNYYHPSATAFGQNGVRRGYGGTLRKPWGRSSHEWGLGKG